MFEVKEFDIPGEAVVKHTDGCVDGRCNVKYVG